MPVTPSPAVARACDVLELLAEHPGSGLKLAEIARRVGMPRATCHTVLLALSARGYVVRHEPDIAYTLGPACVRLGEAAQRASPALAEASIAAHALAEQTGLATAVVARSGDAVSIAVVALAADPFGPALQPGQSVPLVAPFGVVFVAWSDDDAFDTWLSRCEPPLDREERDRYRRAIDAVRRRGYSVTIAAHDRPTLLESLLSGGSNPTRATRRRRDRMMQELAHSEYLPTELHPDRAHRVTQVTAPVFDHAGNVALALLLVGPAYELGNDEIAALGASVLTAAERVTDRIGGAGTRTLESS